MNPVSLDVALAPRMALVAQAMAERIPDCGDWTGYRADEPLDGRYEHPSELGGAPTVTYTRRGTQAHVTLGFLRMVDVIEQHRGDPVVTERGVEERRAFRIKLPAGVRDTRTIEHEFTKSISYSVAASRAWEVAAKASISAEYAGIKGALEVSGKYGESLARTDSGSETTRDRVSEELEFVGPVDTTLEAYRSLNRESRLIRAVCDFDGKVYWWGGPSATSAWEFTTFRTQFLPVARRTAPAEIYGWREFRDRPLSDAEIAALEAPSGLVIEFTAEYDDVQTLTLREAE